MWKRHLFQCLVLSFAASACVCDAAELHVPAQFMTIQEAIDAASDGDTAIVAPGRYPWIAVINKSIMVRSVDPGSPEIARDTVIEARAESGASVYLVTKNVWSPQTPPGPLIQRSTINGFTIEGGISCDNMYFSEKRPDVNTPTIINNIIGRGIGANYSSPCIIGNTIAGGIYVSSNDEEMIIAKNIVHSGRYDGIGIGWDSRAPVIVVDNTIADNSGPGVFVEGQPVLHILRTLITGNMGAGIDVVRGQIMGNTICGNANSTGLGYRAGGINMRGSDHLIEGNIIAGNQGDGGGIILTGYRTWVRNNLICGNRSLEMVLGSAIAQMYGSYGGHVMGNTIVGNSGGWEAVGIPLRSGHGFLVANNVVWNNSPNRLDLPVLKGTACVEHCNIQGGRDMVSPSVTWGPGNIDADPLFVDLGHWDDAGTPDDPSDDTFILGDYHLLPGSPCIDAGTNDVDNPDTPEVETLPATDVAGLPRIIDGNLDGTATVDIGACEYLPGDLNYDGRVNVLDLLLVRNSLGRDPASSTEARKADVNADGAVNVLDLLVVRGRLGK